MMLGDFFLQQGRDLEEVAHHAEVGDLEDRHLRSLLTATIVLDVCMPARCWIAPEMPSAM